MFRKVANNYATNDTGIDVRGVSRDTFEYREGNHILRIGREAAVTDDGRPAQIIYLDNFLRWEPPFDKERIVGGDIDRISGNLIAAFAALGVPTFTERRGI